MRIIIVAIIIICMIDNCEGIRGIKMNKFLNNLNKAIYNNCNKKAYNLTNNIEIYKCLNMNNSNKCSHLENFTEYNNIRYECIEKNNNEFSYGIIITIIMWLVLSLSFH